ncbi:QUINOPROTEIN ALCOHOL DEHYDROGENASE (CYTOCHROME C) [Salix koriyanagi]|uniref:QUINOPROTEIN ALCOHOL DEHYDROGENASE (CYTOCHROME C) n=1 Tax=Salix koriyanagi TaxID=2511006 RepID=A0A9Q0V085_9ROSI|nr:QUINOPROTEIN ALCOHOL DEHYDROGENASE (CYTOCHROME C) [Salix koriyanagi]
MLLTIVANRTRRDVAVAVQKSGFAFALDRDTGSIVWSKLAGPGGLEGGGTWGAATDGRTVYTNIVNSNGERFTLAPSNQTTTAGAWDRWLPMAPFMQWMPKPAIFYGHTTLAQPYTAAYQQVTGAFISEMATPLAWQGSTLLGLVELHSTLSAIILPESSSTSAK